MYSGLEFLVRYKTEDVLSDRKLQRQKDAIIKSHFSLDNESCNYQNNNGRA